MLEEGGRMLNNADWRDCKVERVARGSKINCDEIPQFLWDPLLFPGAKNPGDEIALTPIRLSLITREERIEELQRNCTLRIGR